MSQSIILDKIRIFLLINKIDELAREHLKFLKSNNLEYEQFEHEYKELRNKYGKELNKTDFNPAELFSDFRSM